MIVIKFNKHNCQFKRKGSPDFIMDIITDMPAEELNNIVKNIEILGASAEWRDEAIEKALLTSLNSRYKHTFHNERSFETFVYIGDMIKLKKYELLIP